MSGASPRCGLFQQRSARVVRLVRESSAARECLERLHGVLRSSLDAWNEALQTGATNDTFGCAEARLRWGRRFVAPWVERRLPVDFWSFGDGVGGLRLVCGGLERELAVGWIFYQKVAKCLLWGV